MFHFKIFFLLLTLLPFAFNQPQEAIFRSNNTEYPVIGASSSSIFNIKYEDMNSRYLRIKVQRDESTTFKYDLIVGKTENDVQSLQNGTHIISGTNDHLIYVPDTMMNRDDYYVSFYLNVVNFDNNINGTFTLICEEFDYIEITNESDYSFVTPEESNYDTLYFKFNRTKELDEFTFHVINNNCTECAVKLVYVEGVLNFTIDNAVTNAFHGGKLYKLKDFLKPFAYRDNQYFVLEYTSPANTLTTIGVDYPQLDKTITVGTTVYNYIDTSFPDNNCYRIKYNEEQKFKAIVTSTTGVRAYLSDRLSGHVHNKEIKVNINGILSFTKEDLKNNTFLCFATLQNKTVAYFEARLIDATDLSKPSITLDPLHLGVSYSFELEPEEYQLYQFNLVPPEADSISMPMYQVIEKSGNLEVSAFSTDSYPDVHYDAESPDTYNVVGVNGHYFNMSVMPEQAMNTWSNNQKMLAVKCKSSNNSTCSFEVMFYYNIVDKQLFIKENVEYIQYGFIMGEIGQMPKLSFYYSFIIPDDSIDNVYVEIDTKAVLMPIVELSKDGTPFDNAQLQIHGTKQVYHITKANFNNTGINGMYHLTTTLNTKNSCVWSVKYYTTPISTQIKEVTISGGFVDTRSLKAQEQEIIHIRNPYIHSDKPFMTTITPLKCDVEVSYSNNTLTYNEYGFIQHFAPSGKDIYTYNIKSTSNSTDDCIVYIASTSLDDKATLVINENIPISFKYNEQLRSVTVITFVISPSLSLALRTDTDKVLHVRQIFKGDTEGQTEMFSKLKTSENVMLSFQEVMMVLMFTNDIYYNYFTVSDPSPSINATEFKVDFLAYSFNPGITYLDRTSAVIKLDQYSLGGMYYTKVEHNEELDIVFHTEKSLHLAARLVKRDIAEKISDSMILSKYGLDEDEVSFPQQSNVITLTKDDTNICENGCYFLIVYAFTNPGELEENNLAESYQHLQFYVNLKSNDKQPITVPLNEYIYGAITNKDINDYFTVVLPTSVKKYAIDFQSEMCSLYRNQGVIKPTSTANEGYVTGKGMDSFKTFNVTTSQQQTFTVVCNDLYNVDQSKYKFRIRTNEYERKNMEIIPIFTRDDVQCKIDNENTFCDFLLRVEVLSDYPAITFHATGDNMNDDLTIYARLIEKAVFTLIDLKNMLPHQEGDNVVSSAQSFIKNHLKVEYQSGIATYILVSVHSTKRGIITLSHSFNNASTKPFIPDYSSVLMNLDPNQQIELFNNRSDLIRMNVLEGEVAITCAKNDKQIITGTHSTFIMSFMENDSKVNQCTFMSNKDSIVSLSYTNQLKGSFVSEIQLGVDLKTKMHLKDAPIVLYAKLYQDEDFVYSFKYNYGNSAVLQSFTRTFKINAYIVKYDTIYKMKQNPKMEIVGDKIEGEYNMYSGYGSVKINRELIKESEVYVMIVIDLEPGSPYFPTLINCVHALIPSTQAAQPITHDHYHFDSIRTNPNKYMLCKREQSDDISMYVEFLSSNALINFVVSEQMQSETFENTTSLIEDAVYNEGKTMLKLNPQNDCIYLSVFIDESNETTRTTTETFKYAFKYVLTPKTEAVRETIKDFTEFGVVTKTVEEDGEDHFSLNIDATQFSLSTLFIVRVFERKSIPENGYIGTMLLPIKPLFEETFTSSNPSTPTFKNLNPNEYVISVVALIETNTEAIGSPMIQTFNMLTHVVNMTFNEFAFNKVITTNRNSFNGGSVIGYMNITQHSCEQYKLQVRAKQHFNDSTLLSDKEVFEVSAYFVSNDFISGKYNDPLLQPSTTKHTAKKYSLDHNFIVYMQKSEGDNNSEFIFFEITKPDDIMNEYLNDDYLIEVIGYCPANQPEFTVTENATYVGKIDSIVTKNYYLIDLGENVEFQDFSFELISNYDDNNKTYINYTIEPYESDVRIVGKKTSEYLGITYVTVEYTEQQPEQKPLKFLITIFGDNERPEFEYSFKWSKENAAERILSNYHNLFIESKTTGITLEVTFNNLQQELSLSNAVYYLRMYESGFEQIMYLEEDNVKPKIEPIYETRLGYSDQETTTAYLKLPELNREYFITLSLYARIADNAEDFKLGYMPLMINPVLEGLENTNEFFPLTDVFKVVKLPDDSDDFTVLGFTTRGIDNNAKLGIAFITYDDLEPLYHGYFMSPSSYMQFHTVEGTGSISVKRTSKYTEYMLITLEATSTQNTKIALIVLPYNNKAYDFILPTNKYFIDSFMEGNDNHKIYTLTKQNEEDEFIEIEFDFMLNEKDFKYAIEEYVEGREPTFETNETLIYKRIEGEFSQYKIIVNVTNIDKILLSFIGKANSHYEFKYKSYVQYTEHTYEYNSEFKVIGYDNINIESSSYQYPSVNIEIANPFFNQTEDNDTISYYFAIVQHNDNINTSKLESAYLPVNELNTDDEIIYKHTNPIIIQTNTTNQLHELTVQLPYKLKKAYMVCVAILTKASTLEQTKLVFKSHTFNFNQQKLQEVIFNKEQKLTEVFGLASDEYYTMLSEINDSTIVLAGRSIRVDITYTNLIDNRIIKGYIVDSEYVTQRRNALVFDPEFEGIEGKIISNENSIHIDFSKFETEPQQPLYIYITVQRKSIDDTSSKSFTIYPHLDTNAFVPKMNQHFIKHLYSARRTITYKVDTEESLYIEYGLEKMNQNLTVVIEELTDEHPELTFTTYTTFNVVEESKGGKNYVILSNSTHTDKPIIYVTFINNEEVDDVLFFVKFDSQCSSEYMETYNAYTQKVEINADLDNSEMTLNFANMLHHFNNIGLDDPYKAEILLYLIDNNETDTILYDSLYMNNNNEHPLFKPKMIRPIVFPESPCLDEPCNVETYFKVNKNELLAIKIRVYNKEYSHRFGYELLVHDTTPDYLYEIEPDHLKPFCIDQGFSHLNLYFSVKEKANKLPSFAFKYFNYKTYRDPGEVPFTITGYAVDQQFINDKIRNPSQTPELPANSTKAMYLFRERSAYLSLSKDIKVINEFAYIELRSDSRAIDTICFDVIPSYPDEVPESSFIQDKYFYEPMLENRVSFKLEAKEGHAYHVIDIIDGNNTDNFEYIVETNKETPTYKEDLNVSRTIEKGRTKLTIDSTKAFLRGEYKQARSTINDTVLLLHITKTNSKDGFVLLKHSTFETKENALEINYDKNVTYERKEEGQLTITFNSIYYNYPNTFKSFKYYIRGYLDTSAISEKDLNSFIIDNDNIKVKPIVSEEFEVNDGVIKVEKKYTLDAQHDQSYLLFKVIGESVGKDGSEEKYLYNVAEIKPVITDLTLLYIFLPIGIVILLVGVFLLIRKYRKSNIRNIEDITSSMKSEKEQPLV